MKLQTYTADTMTIDHDGPDFRIKGGLWDGRRLYELYQEAHTPWDWHTALFAKGRELGMTVFSTPFDDTAVELLQELQAPAYKIASFEMIDLPLIRASPQPASPPSCRPGWRRRRRLAKRSKPSMLPAAASLCCSIASAAIRRRSSNRISDRIPRLAAQFGCPVGLSDHTLGIEVAIASVALGACLIEKHFTLRRADGGPDLGILARAGRARGAGARRGCRIRGARHRDGGALEVEEGNKVFRRSLYVVDDIGAGEILTAKNIRIIRPGFGLAPKHLPDVIGKRARRALPRGTALSWDAIE